MVQKDRAFLNHISAGHVVLNEGKSTCTLTIAGDLSPIGRAEALLVNKHFKEVWGGLLEILTNGDLSVVNLECPLTYRKTPILKAGPHLRADPRCAESIHAGGFDVVTLANNHILDMGQEGLLDTCQACQEAGLSTVGVGRNLSEANRPLIQTVKGIRVAIIALAEHEFSIATYDKAGACALDPIENYYQIMRAKELADFVLVVFHGGNEYYALPSPRMVKTCRYFVDCGAHAVVCHHTHVPSGIEFYHDAPIVYGTGNFLFDWPQPRQNG